MNMIYIFLTQVKRIRKKCKPAFTNRHLSFSPSENKTPKGGIITLTNGRKFSFSLLCYNSASECLSLKVNVFFEAKDCGKYNHNSFSIGEMQYFKEYNIGSMLP